ncbi:cobalt-precorrin-6A reductase [Wenxinia marina]|uniref:Precorrin-6x reductase n=1 Tax=Wenxinia marina DSM 24838 TaxID=1123501 RepID=A0A0D0NHJ9_9RHOB|nr:cobalt-precorrin-6A reductase [Wenxinia marina]KIQ67810.1 Precorrin-6x reductase [Wenxinia marina DSM 24838]GGL74873.1 precorrin-6A reductase [Wenxinia marina]
MKVLLLAGTREGREMAERLSRAGVPALVSLAGATDRPLPLPLPTRRGGFGGAEGFLDCLRVEGITAVVDATHPFAARITDRTGRLCAEQGVPYLQILRPGWQEGDGDRWTRIARLEDAAGLIPTGATVFLATGRQSLGAAAELAGRRLMLRVIDPPKEPFPIEGGDYVVGRPPFTLDAEKALFALTGVDWLVVKDSGGDEGRAKLDAARALGLPVALIDRPPLPDAPRVTTAEAAMAWVRGLPL